MKVIKSYIFRVIPKRYKFKIEYFFSFMNYKKFKPYKNKKKIIHLLTPIHGNMGDQAIAYATNEFIKKEFSEYQVIEIYREEIYKYAKAIKRILSCDDYIFLIGGGNMGNLWIDEEVDRRFILKKFKNTKIVSMPQTISFTQDKDGLKELEKSKKIYNKHKNLIIIARENKSFRIMKKEFLSEKIILNPDIVLYLNTRYKINNNNRSTIMTCLRSDKESILGENKNMLIQQLNSKYKEVFNYDTVIKKNVKKEEREKELNIMLDQFRNSKVVITDRLHGMIFAAITKTPCIVTKSLDYKVTGTYEWIKDLNYIRLVDRLEFEKIKPIIDELIELKEFSDIDFKEKYFNNLTKELKKILAI